MPTEVSAPPPTAARGHVLLTILAIVLVLAGGLAVYKLFQVFKIEPPRVEDAKLAPLVESLVIQPENVTEQYIGYATATADRSAKLASEVSGTVIERVGRIRVGTPVTADQPLIRLDAREYDLAHKRATALANAEQASLDEIAVERAKLEQLIATSETELRIAESERSRVTKLFENEQAAKKEYDFAMLAYQTARRTVLGYERELDRLGPRGVRFAASVESYKASAGIALLNVERCTIKAPFDGTIDGIFVDAGDRVGPGTIVVSVVDTHHIEVPLQLPGASYAEIRVGAPVNLTCESMPQAPWRGTIVRRSPVIDPQTRTYAAYVTVDNRQQDQALVPGTFVTATVDGATLRDRLLVPRRAIRNGRIFVLRDGRAQLRRVETERTVIDRAVVSGDLNPGDAVILSRLDALIDGLRVRSAAQTATTSDHETTITGGTAP